MQQSSNLWKGVNMLEYAGIYHNVRNVVSSLSVEKKKKFNINFHQKKKKKVSNVLDCSGSDTAAGHSKEFEVCRLGN